MMNEFRRRVKRGLGRIEEDAFNRWLEAIKSSKNSQITDLPSSQIKSRMSLISIDYPQLFVIIDTCSLVKHRVEFMDFVVRQKQLFSANIIPIRFIITCTVLEELDKCNRPAKRRRGEQQQVPLKQESSVKNESDPQTKDVVDMANGRPGDPPRMFMRFIEEEMRASEVLVPELDPFKRTQLQEQDRQFEIINKDDRILECCLRSKAFIEHAKHHEATQVILITEDNVFKAKATTFMLTSYRWREFKHKYHNFGLEHYRSTPIVMPLAWGDNLNRATRHHDESTNTCILIESKSPVAESQPAGTTGTLLASQKFNRLCGPEFGGSSDDESASVTIVGEVINII